MPKVNYKVEDIKALQIAYPQFVKLVPDYRKISAALKLGIDVPGIQSEDETAVRSKRSA